MVSAEPIPATDATARRPRSRPWITANRLLAALLLAEIAIIWANVNNWADFGVNRLRTFYILAAIVLLPPAVASIRFAIAVIARRWRFQFGVSSVLLVMTICAAASAWLAWRIKQYRIEEDDVRTIYAARGEVGFDDSGSADKAGPKWLRRLLGDRFFGHAVAAGVSDSATAQLLGHEWMSQLESVSLTDRNPAHMGSDDWQSEINDDALNYIDKLHHLKSLQVVGSLSDSGMAKIGRLEHLRDIALSVDAQGGVCDLDRMHDLRHVTLFNINDAGLARLQSATQITRLELFGCKITDAGMATIERLTNLVHLDLAGSTIAIAELSRLKRLTNLKYLNVMDTPVAPLAAKELAPVLPHCRIVFGHKGGVAGPLQPLPDQ